MNLRNRKDKMMANVLLGAGLMLLDSLRDRISDGISDVGERARAVDFGEARDRIRSQYKTASDRVGRAADALRGEDSSAWTPILAGLIGVGVGIGIGMLMAPASGEETRRTLSERAREGFSSRTA
jgi:hypothetical protein